MTKDDYISELEADRGQLLATLKELVKATEGADNPTDMGVSSHEEVMEEARAAIAKSEALIG